MAPPATHLIGLLGYAGSGKDTVASILHELGFAWASVGGIVRDECAIAWGVSPELFADRSSKDTLQEALSLTRCSDADFVRYHSQFAWSVATPRQIMQLWGDHQRSLDPFHYVDCLAASVRLLHANGHTATVVSDVRLPIEAMWIEGQCGSLWRVVRPGAGPVNRHHTETALDRWEVAAEILNQFDVEHLRRTVIDLLQPMDV